MKCSLPSYNVSVLQDEQPTGQISVPSRAHCPGTHRTCGHPIKDSTIIVTVVVFGLSS